MIKPLYLYYVEYVILYEGNKEYKKLNKVL